MVFQALNKCFSTVLILKSLSARCLMTSIVIMKNYHRCYHFSNSSQILDALLKVLASGSSISVQIKWHTGWFLWKLLVFQGNSLDEHNFHLFNVRILMTFCFCFWKTELSKSHTLQNVSCLLPILGFIYLRIERVNSSN